MVILTHLIMNKAVVAPPLLSSFEGVRHTFLILHMI